MYASERLHRCSSMATSCCAATDNRELFRAVLRHPDMVPFHEEARRHLRHLIERVDEADDISLLSSPSLSSWSTPGRRNSSRVNGDAMLPARFSVDIPDELWQEHVHQCENRRLRRTSLHYNIADYSSPIVSVSASQQEMDMEEPEVKSKSLPSQFAPLLETARQESRASDEKTEDDASMTSADDVTDFTGTADDREHQSMPVEVPCEAETAQETTDDVMVTPQRRTSTVTTLVIEKRQRVLDTEDPDAEEDKQVLLSSLFRYSKDYTRERQRLQKANSTETFLRVLRLTFERYREELHALSSASVTMFEEQKEVDTHDNSVAVMMSLCDMCESEAAIIDLKLTTAAEAGEEEVTEDERQSLCRLLDTLVKMLDELKNEMVRIRRISDRASSVCQPIPERVVEHFV